MKRLSPLVFAAFLTLTGCSESHGGLAFENINATNYDEQATAIVAQVEAQDKEKARQLAGALITLNNYERLAYQALAGSEYELRSKDLIYSRRDKVVNGRTVDDVIAIGKLVFAEAQTADSNRITRLDHRVKRIQQLQDNLLLDFTNIVTGFEYRKGSGGQGIMKLAYTAKNNSSLNVRGFLARLEFARKDTGEVVYHFNVPVKVGAGDLGPGQTINESYRISTQTSFLRLHFLERFDPSDLTATMVPLFISESVNYKAEMAAYAPLAADEKAFVDAFNYIADAFGAKRIGTL
jgi:hypothetical protein